MYVDCMSVTCMCVYMCTYLCERVCVWVCVSVRHIIRFVLLNVYLRRLLARTRSLPPFSFRFLTWTFAAATNGTSPDIV